MLSVLHSLVQGKASAQAGRRGVGSVLPGSHPRAPSQSPAHPLWTCLQSACEPNHGVCWIWHIAGHLGSREALGEPGDAEEGSASRSTCSGQHAK